MKKQLIKKIISIFFIISTQALYSSDIDILLDHLVEKGIIDGPTAHEIRYQTEEETKRKISKGTHRTLPIWLQYVTIGGDLRIRYQHDSNDNLTYERKRARIRARFNVNSKINDSAFIYIGLATGENNDPRSTNQTMTDNFSKKGIYLDYAYGEWMLNKYFIFTTGKIKSPFFLSNDAIWDSDINQEGFSLTFDKNFTSNLRTQLKSGFFLLKENSNAIDQKLNYYSIRTDLRNDESTTKGWIAINQFDFKNIKGAQALPNRPNSTNYLNANTLISSKYAYSYRISGIDFETTKIFENPLSILFSEIKSIGLFGTIFKNTAISEKKGNEGYVTGIKIGHEKVTDEGEFQISFTKRYIEKNSILDTYPDSDFYGGSTDVVGYKLSLTWGVGYNSNINVNYFYSKPIESNKKKDNLIQVDLNFKF